MKAEVDNALRTGDTIGGVFEVIVHGLPPASARTPTGTSASTACSRRR